MPAAPAKLTPSSRGNGNRRQSPRRKLWLDVDVTSASGTTNVRILDVSSTGLLFETGGELGRGETIELNLPEAGSVSGVITWVSGPLLGCEFKRPISSAAVSASLLRSPARQKARNLAPAHRSVAAVSPVASGPAKLPANVRMRWIVGLTLLPWAAIGGALVLAV